MPKHEIRRVDKLDEKTSRFVGKLFRDMYEEMHSKGLLLPLDEKGEEKWLHSVSKTLGRYSCLVIAREEGRITGFAHGALKFTPDYLKSQKVGVVSHIFVDRSSRETGIGKEMLEQLEKWFHARDVRSIELQVLSGNEEGIRFWEGTGFARELYQYRKIIR